MYYPHNYTICLIREWSIFHSTVNCFAEVQGRRQSHYEDHREWYSYISRTWKTNPIFSIWQGNSTSSSIRRQIMISSLYVVFYTNTKIGLIFNHIFDALHWWLLIVMPTRQYYRANVSHTAGGHVDNHLYFFLCHLSRDICHHIEIRRMTAKNNER